MSRESLASSILGVPNVILRNICTIAMWEIWDTIVKILVAKNGSIIRMLIMGNYMGQASRLFRCLVWIGRGISTGKGRGFRRSPRCEIKAGNGRILCRKGKPYSAETTLEENDSSLITPKGDRKQEVRLKKIPNGQSSKEEDGPEKGIRDKGDDMCVLLLMSRKRVFGDWLGEIDVWFMKLHQWPIREDLDKLVEMSKIQIIQKVAKHGI